MTVYSVANGSWVKIPVTSATTRQTGVTTSQRKMPLADNNLRRATGSSIAAVTRRESGPSRLVAGTSEYIHAARTRAKANVPCSVNTLSFSSAGSRNQDELIRAPLTATVTRRSKGGRNARTNSVRTAWRSVAGRDTSAGSATGARLPRRTRHAGCGDQQVSPGVPSAGRHGRTLQAGGCTAPLRAPRVPHGTAGAAAPIPPAAPLDPSVTTVLPPRTADAPVHRPTWLRSTPVPLEDDRLLTLPPEHAERRRPQHEVAPGSGVEAQPPGSQHPEHMGMGHAGDVTGLGPTAVSYTH